MNAALQGRARGAPYLRVQPGECLLDLRTLAVEQGQAVNVFAFCLVKLVGFLAHGGVVPGMGQMQGGAFGLGELFAGVIGGEVVEFVAVGTLALQQAATHQMAQHLLLGPGNFFGRAFVKAGGEHAQLAPCHTLWFGKLVLAQAQGFGNGHQRGVLSIGVEHSEAAGVELLQISGHVGGAAAFAGIQRQMRTRQPQGQGQSGAQFYQRGGIGVVQRGIMFAQQGGGFGVRQFVHGVGGAGAEHEVVTRGY